MTKRHMEDHEHDAMVDSIRCRREEPTEYRPPETDQKWRARNVISFHFRHFNYKCPPSYRDVLLCAIDHANPTTGRCDARQRTMAQECNLARATVNRALLWWSENTYFLTIENRGPGRSNAYHIQWANLEADWYGIQERIQVPRIPRTRGVVITDITGGVTTDITWGVITDITPRTLKKNLKEEPHHEMARSLTANDTHDNFLENQFGEIIRLPSERVDRPKGIQEGANLSAEPRSKRVIWWTNKLNEVEAELQQCTQSDRWKELEEKIARCRAQLEEPHHEQRSKVGASGK